VLVPLKAAKKLQGQVVYFLQERKNVNDAHFKLNIGSGAGRCGMSPDGTGTIYESAFTLARNGVASSCRIATGSATSSGTPIRSRTIMRNHRTTSPRRRPASTSTLPPRRSSMMASTLT